MPHLTSPLTSDTSAPDPVARAGASTARSAGATLAAAAMTCGGVALGTRTEANSVPAAVTVGAVVVAVALTVALVASLRRTSTARRWALVALGLSMAASAYAGWQAWRDVSGGMPTRTLPLLAGATALAVASSLALTIAGGQTTRPRRTGAVWSWIAGVTAGLLAVFLVVGAVIVAPHPGPGADQGAQRIQRCLRFRLLPEPDRRVQHHHREDHRGIDVLAERDGVGAGDEQDVDQGMVELTKEAAEHPAAGGGG